MNEWEWQLLEDKTVLADIDVRGVRVRRGDKVRLCPRRGGDVLDLALTGRNATIESLEQDYEGNVHICVVVDDDPGRDIGLLRQPGHRFFFAPEDLEPVSPAELGSRSEAFTKKILIAGIGNIFLGDDGFGVEVANRLAERSFPAGVRVADFGIRGFDLAYALMEGYETTILIDAYPAEASPGTLVVVEPDLGRLTSEEADGGLIEPHAMNPVNVLRTAARMGAQLKRVLVVGCVPATLGPEEGQMGLSEPVTAAAEEATQMVRGLVDRILGGEWPRTK
jgi:hydrogenase maturation protease